MPSLRSLLPLPLPLLLSTAHSQSSPSSCCDLSPGYDPIQVATQAIRLASHSWEYGTLSEALLQLYSPELSVFSPSAFPNGSLPAPDVPSTLGLSYALPHISLTNSTLIYADGAAGDPASLGPATLLIAQTKPEYLPPAVRQLSHFLIVPRHAPSSEKYRGAISHREKSVSVWADFISMAPPFFASFAVALNTTDTLDSAWRQCGAYRDLLQVNSTSTAEDAGGAWKHIVGGVNEDAGIWSTGNGWVVLGMARVLATVLHWDRTARDVNWQGPARDLFEWMGEILSVAMQPGNVEESSGLLRNYWNSPAGEEVWFGEVSGTAVIAAVVFRLAVLQREPESFWTERIVTPEMLRWAEGLHAAVGKRVDRRGLASPAVDPLSWGSRTPYTKGSPEGQSFVVMVYAAWRDCVGAGVCGV